MNVLTIYIQECCEHMEEENLPEKIEKMEGKSDEDKEELSLPEFEKKNFD